MKIVEKTVTIAGVLNIILPMILTPLATAEEIKPTGGASSLDMKGQFMHMMVHHNQVKLTSTLIVMLIVYLSIMLAHRM